MSQRGFLILQSGGLGDVVLTGNLVYLIRKAHPSARIALICQGAFADVPRLYPAPPDGILPLSFNPYTVATLDGQLLDSLRQMAAELNGWMQPATVISAEFRCTWLSSVVAALAPAEAAICASPPAGQNNLAKRVVAALGVEVRRFQSVELQEGLTETERYCRLAEAAAGAQPEAMPRWELPPEIRREAGARLAALGLDPGSYLVCCPFAASKLTAVKRWDPGRFQEVLRRARERYSVSILVVGEPGEETELEEFAASVGDPALHTLPATLGLLAGLTANARCFLSNDSGPSHLAQAYRVPTVVVSGGGAWPAYQCWAPGATAVVNPLPCYGCAWDCLFDTALCVDAIGVEDLWNAMRQIFESPPSSAATVTLTNVPDTFFPWLESAARRRKELRRELDLRQEVIQELSDEAQKRLEIMEDLAQKLREKTI